MVSIIVPVYNTEKYLQECIDSILSQTYSDFEVLLVDDGSTDKSGIICDEYALRDSRTHVYHKENGGVSSARNLGLKNAKGEWVCFVDSDDVVEPVYLEKLLHSVLNNNANSSVGGYRYIDNSSQVEVSNENDGCMNAEEVVRDFYTFRTPDWQKYLWNRLFSSRVIRDNNLRFNEKIFYKEDGLFFIQFLCVSNGKVGCCKDIIYNYRQNRDSAMGQLQQGFTPKLLTNIQSHQLIIKVLKEYHFSDKVINIAKQNVIQSVRWIRNVMRRAGESKLSYEMKLEILLLKSIGITNYIDCRVRSCMRILKWRTRTFFYRFYNNPRLWLAQIIPLQKKVVFCNHFGKGFADDPKYIALAMLRRGTKAKLYWMTNDLNIELPKGITPLLYGSDKARWHLHTAKVWVYNIKNAFKVEKREGQFYLQTWHGTYGLKKVERDAEEFLSKEYKADTIKDSSMIDLLYGNNTKSIDVFKHSFWYDGPVIYSSIPHLSIFKHIPNDLKKNICEKLGITFGKKIILYAPTFRNNQDTKVYSFNYDTVIQALNQRFGGEFIICYRLHPNVDFLSCNINSDSVIDVSHYPDVYELMAIADVLITDFSSVAFEIAIKNTPVFIFAKDYDEYVKNERGLVGSYDEAPFSIAKDEETLCNNILSFDLDEYKHKVDIYLNQIGMVENGDGDEHIASIIENELQR